MLSWTSFLRPRGFVLRRHMFSSYFIESGWRGVDGHLPLAHTLWSQVIKKGEIVIDATCGRGNDSLVLCHLALKDNSGLLYCVDIQEKAIKETQNRLTEAYGSLYVSERVRFIHGNHGSFPPTIPPESVSAVIYNLGYLPGTSEEGKMRLSTHTESTILSFTNALPLLKIGGILSATAYRGHAQGMLEAKACEDYFSLLDQTKWRVYCHSPLNTMKGAILFTVCRRL